MRAVYESVLVRVRTASRTPFRVALVVAFLIHLPLQPLSVFPWFRWLFAETEPDDKPTGELILPLDLDLEDASSKPPPASEPVAAPPGVPTPPADKAPLGTNTGKAGADASEKSTKEEDAGPKAPNIRDPLNTGGPAQLMKQAVPHPNVQVLISGERIRKHELGTFFGQLLTGIPEWSAFFQGTGLDPIRDFDHVLIAGPQFRNAAREIVAIMDYNVPEARVREAAEAVVERTHGQWLEEGEKSARVALIHPDGVDRLLTLFGKRLVGVFPGDAREHLRLLTKVKPFRTGSDVAIVLRVMAPSRAFREAKKYIHIPESFAWFRVQVTPTHDGGADIALEAEDASEGDAKKHADDLAQNIQEIRAMSSALDVPLLGNLLGPIEILDSVHLNATGKRVWSEIHLNRRQLSRIMGWIEAGLNARTERRKAAPP